MNFQIDKKLKVQDICVSPADSQSGQQGTPCGRFLVYPKFWVSGETELTKAQIETGLHNFIFDDLRPLVKDAIISQGGTNIECDIITPFGYFDCNGVLYPDHHGVTVIEIP